MTEECGTDVDCGGPKMGPLQWNMECDEFKCWSELLKTRTGIAVPAERKSFLIRGLRNRMNEVGIASFGEYYDYILSGTAGAWEWNALVDHLTVHESRFFRHPASLDLIREHLISHRSPKDRPASWQLWSVGCATGEEPYTLAIVVEEELSRRGVRGYFGVLATDVSRAALAVGRQAVYHQRKLTEVDRTLLERYFTPVDGELMRVREALRERVCFAHQNVLELGKAAMGLMDIVVCQNVLIYFDRDRRIEILDSLLQFLSPGGLIVLGSGEILAWSNPQVERVPREDTLAFRRLPR